MILVNQTTNVPVLHTLSSVDLFISAFLGIIFLKTINVKTWEFRGSNMFAKATTKYKNETIVEELKYL